MIGSHHHVGASSTCGSGVASTVDGYIPAMDTSTSPPAISPQLGAQMSRLMREFVTAHSRRRNVPTTLHLGRPEEEVRTILDHPSYDDGLRADLVTRAIDGLAVPEPLVWMTRPGDLGPSEVDLGWLRAARAGFDRHGRALTSFHVLTRHGWTELVSGQRHARVRIRRSA